MQRISLASLAVAPLMLLAIACQGLGPTAPSVTGRKAPGDITFGAQSQLAPPTNCTLQKIPPPSGYLKVSWTNGDASASTEVWINANGVWNLVSTESPGITQYFYILGGQHGLFYARVRHVKAGFDPSNYCNTGSVTV